MIPIDFLLQAKILGYATDAESRKIYFDDGSKGFEFAKDGFRYLDRYYGFDPFAGAEHIYDKNGTLLWIMNYYGETVLAQSDSHEIYAFLREAMSSITPEYPFRGPAELKKGRLRYENEQDGTLDRFHGVESIYDGGERVYYLHYHGGSMMKNQ